MRDARLGVESDEAFNLGVGDVQSRTNRRICRRISLRLVFLPTASVNMTCNHNIEARCACGNEVSERAEAESSRLGLLFPSCAGCLTLRFLFESEQRRELRKAEREAALVSLIALLDRLTRSPQSVTRRAQIVRYHDRRTAGLCVQCGSESKLFTRCRRCRLMAKEYREAA
jgi:predicted RNA-binding Zn-ribbon protein involved in translation (DUF1610 family)